MDRIYFDNSASTPLHPKVKACFVEALEIVGNPSSAHADGQRARVAITQARRDIADLLGVMPNEIVFTSGGTEGCNAAILGMVAALPSHKKTILCSNIEHSATKAPLEILKSKGFNVEYFDPFSSSFESDFLKKVSENVACVIAMAVNNETGSLLPVDFIGDVCEHARIPFFSDAVAAFGNFSTKLPPKSTLSVLSGHKLHAPKGVGILYIKNRTPFLPYIVGGPQEGQKRAGCPHLPGILALREALFLPWEEMRRTTQFLRDFFEKSILEMSFGALVNGHKERSFHISNLYFPKFDGETLLIQMDLSGISASMGSACSSGSIEPSPTLLAFGYPKDRVLRSIRFSFSAMNRQEEVEKALSFFKNL